MTADRTGKIVLLTYSLTASHCSTEAHLAGVPISALILMLFFVKKIKVFYGLFDE